MRTYLLFPILVLGACGPMDAGDVLGPDNTSSITKTPPDNTTILFDDDVRVLPASASSLWARRVDRGNRKPRPDSGVSTPDASLPPVVDVDAGTEPIDEVDAGAQPPDEVDAGTQPPAEVDAGAQPPDEVDAGTTPPVEVDAGAEPPAPVDAGTTPPVEVDAGTEPPAPDPPATTTEVFQVSGRFLYDPCGNKVILRGINKMNIWTDPTGSRSFDQIARTGANVVRIVWDTTGTAAALDVVIARAVANKLLPMVELHDATGNWSMLQTLVNYWVRADVLAVLKRHESALLVNIGNEVGNGTVTAEQFRSGYTLAITRMRQAGIQAPLVIDSTQWGYNIDMIQANGPYLIAQDPLRNLIFSTHAYWSDWTAARIEAEIKESADLGLPMIIGEFAAAGFTCAVDVDYQAIMASSQAHETGWIAWSWGPGNTPCGVMDMTTDNSYESLHDWGLVAAVTGANSIQNTAQPIPFMQNLSCH